MLTVKPFVSRALRRLGCDTHYKSCALRSWEFEPACESERFAAIFEEEDLQRVTSTAPHTTLEYQVEQLRAGRYRHAARRAHLFRHAVMVDGHIFTLRMVHPMAFGPMPGVSLNSLAEIDSGVLGTSEYGNKYFGHWFCDDVPMSITAREFGKVYGHANSDNRLIGHQQAYAEIFGWGIELVANAAFRELTILDWSPMTPRQGERFAAMRGRLMMPSETPAHPGVMLLRHTSGQQRVLGNESEIADMVRARGFRVVDPLKSTVAELIDACAGSKVVMGVEGSQLAHGFLPMLAPGGTLLTLQPPFKFDHFWKGRCDAIGARYAFIVGSQTSENGFTIDVDRVQKMLDRLDA